MTYLVTSADVHHNRMSDIKLIGTCVQLFLADAPQFEECQAAYSSAALPRKSSNAFRIVSTVGRMGESPPASYCNNKQLFLLNGWKHSAVTSRWQIPHMAAVATN